MGTREFLERVSRETGVFIATGLIEKAGGSLYCSALYVTLHPVISCSSRRIAEVNGSTEVFKKLIPAMGGTGANSRLWRKPALCLHLS
jgi:nitrilase